MKITISRLMEEMKEPNPKLVGMLLIATVNLPRIEVPTFDGNTVNWRPFWQQFQANVHSKPHLRLRSDHIFEMHLKMYLLGNTAFIIGA